MADNAFLPMAKEDVSMIMEKLTAHDVAIADIQRTLKTMDKNIVRIIDEKLEQKLDQKLTEKFDAFAKNFLREMKFMFEQWSSDADVKYAERVADHEARLKRLEYRTGLAA